MYVMWERNSGRREYDLTVPLPRTRYKMVQNMETMMAV
jgi:hypothetical protein